MLTLSKNYYDAWAICFFVCGGIHLVLAIVTETIQISVRPTDWLLAGLLCKVCATVHRHTDLVAWEMERQKTIRSAEQLPEPKYVPMAAPPPPKPVKPG